MAEKGWFMASVGENHLIKYIFTADNIMAVENVTNAFLINATVNQLTWQELKEWTHCVIPAGQKTTSFAYGNVMIPRGIKPDIVLWPI